MGTFISLSGVIGKTQSEAISSLAKYAKLVGGGLHREVTNTIAESSCIVEESNSNTTILYPSNYFDWDDSSKFISKDLKAPVFSCHIHDGDLWMYVLYNDGEIVDQFNPVPDYWDEDISQNEIDIWKGDAAAVANCVGVKQADIKNYLVRWELEEGDIKAYLSDEFVNEDWQLLDFIKKLGLPYPSNNDGECTGEIYKFWTNNMGLNN